MTKRPYRKEYNFLKANGTPGLYRRNQILYAVLELSQPMRQKLGRSKFSQSLHTEDTKLGRKLVTPIMNQWRELIEEVKSLPDQAAQDRAALRLAEIGGDAEALRKAEEAIFIEHDNIAHSAAISNDPGVTPAYIREAEAHAHGQAEEYVKAVYAVRLSDHVDAWVKADYSGRGERAQEEAKSYVSYFIGGNPTLDDFKANKVQAYGKLLAAGGKSYDTIKKRISYLRSFWKYLCLNDPKLNGYDPFAGFQNKGKARPKGRTHGAFTREQMQKLFDTSTGNLHKLTKLFAYTGARPGELCHIKTEHVFLYGSKYGKTPHFFIPTGKTGNADRVIPIHSAILEEVTAWYANSTDGYLISGEKPDKHGSRYNSRLKGAAGDMIKALGFTKDEYGMELDFYSIRHTVTSQMDEQDVNERTRNWIIGHATSKGAAKSYLQPHALEKMQDAIETISY